MLISLVKLVFLRKVSKWLKKLNYGTKGKLCSNFCNEKKYKFNGDMADREDLFCRKIHEYNFKIFSSSMVDTDFYTANFVSQPSTFGCIDAFRLKATEKKKRNVYTFSGKKNLEAAASGRNYID